MKTPDKFTPGQVSVDERELWLLRHEVLANDALRRLRAEQKSDHSVYARKVRFLKAFLDTLFVKRSDSQQAELFQPEETLNPEIKKILNLP